MSSKALIEVDVDPSTEDAALVAAAKKGHAQAFEMLVRRYQRRILAVALRFTRLQEDAEDVVQQSFQKAFVHLRRFQGKSSFSTWLTRIAINEGLMLLRKRRSLSVVSIDDSSGVEETSFELYIADSAPGPETTYLQREQSGIVSSAVRQLNPRTRKAIELRELSELSTAETARAMGLSVGAVKARVFHGRKKLREALKLYVESTWASGNRVLQTSHKTNGTSCAPLISGACD